MFIRSKPFPLIATIAVDMVTGGHIMARARESSDILGEAMVVSRCGDE